MVKPTDDLTFKCIDTPTLLQLQFSDGNVISIDKEGLIAYSTTKTMLFDSKTTTVLAESICCKDEDVMVIIQPVLDYSKFGLSNDTVLHNGLKVRTYCIPFVYFDKFKEFIVKTVREKIWEDD